MPITAVRITATNASPSPSASTGAPRYVPARLPRRPSLVGVLFAGLVLIGPVLGVTLAAWGFVTARHTTAEQRDIDDPSLSARDQAALGLPTSVTTMFGPGAATAVTEALDAGIALGGTPTRFAQISLYSDFAIAVAQDANRPGLVEQHPWRSGRVGTSSPHPVVDDLDRLSFTIDEVDWSSIARLAGSAAEIAGVEDGAVTHVIVDRSTFDEQLPITIRIYVSGPRGSGFVESSAAGIVLDVY